jgi:hypothetical protein
MLKNGNIQALAAGKNRVLGKLLSNKSEKVAPILQTEQVFIKHIYRQYNCVLDEKVYSGKAPKTPLLNSNYDGSFIAGILQLRYNYSMPVERIVKYLTEVSLRLNASIICSLSHWPISSNIGLAFCWRNCLISSGNNDSLCA